MNGWSNLAKVVYKRTYARKDNGVTETWPQTVARVIEGNLGKYRGTSVLLEHEEERLRYFMMNRKAGPAGRGWWFSGAPAHKRVGGVALNNCWFVSLEEWTTFVAAMDLLMLGGGVGGSIEHRFVSKLPKLKKDVKIAHSGGNDADFIVPDSRGGWCELFRRTLESFFSTGKSFTYSTICVRGAGETIRGFGGTSSGPIPLVSFIDKVQSILSPREGKHVRPIDAMDLLCSVGEMVVSGNVRRSAIIILGDAWDKEYLKAKRWDLGQIPTHRAFANLSVVVDDMDDVHPLFWKTYEQGEPFGIVNRKNIQSFGRAGERRKDTATGVNPCGEATLESFEPCNLQEIALPNLKGSDEFLEAAVLMHRYGKRVTLEQYHLPEVQEVIDRNRRVGTGVTGCLESPLFNPRELDTAYDAIQHENRSYSKQLGIPESIRTTVIKPSGTMSKMLDCRSEGIHAAYSRYFIQRIRFGSNDTLIPLLRAAGHRMEPAIRFDGTYDMNTLVVDFYVETPKSVPVADEDWDTWKQLDVLKMAQKHWADQSVSVTVYYKKEEIPKLKQWLEDNLSNIKTISFLCHNDHGFKQAPKEAVSAQEYEKASSELYDVEMEHIQQGDAVTEECEGGFCPVK